MCFLNAEQNTRGAERSGGEAPTRALEDTMTTEQKIIRPSMRCPNVEVRLAGLILM
jgi:hypothetical protein